MKRMRIGIAALVLGICLQAFGGTFLPAMQVRAAAEKKSGLVKEKKKYFYYKKGKKVKNKWVNVKSKGKKQKYYFGKNGAAYTGVKKVKGKTYYFNKKGQMQKERWYKKAYYFGSDGTACTGIHLIKEKLYAFGDDGKQNTAQTKSLQQYAVQGADAAELRALLGEPSSAEYMPSCMTWEGQTGDDGILAYKNFTVFTFRYGDKEIVWQILKV